MLSSSFSYIVWGLIVLGIFLDAWFIFVLEKHFQEKGIPKNIASRFRYLKNEIPVWLAQAWRATRQRAMQQNVGPALAACTLILAFIPPILVIRQNWFDYRFHLPTIHVGEQSLFVPEYFPGILLCIACVLGLAGLAKTRQNFFGGRVTQMPTQTEAQPRWRRWAGAACVYLSLLGMAYIALASLTINHKPGWDMLGVLGLYLLGWACWDFPFQKLWAAIKTRGGVLLAMALGHVGLVLALYNHFGRVKFSWGLDVLALVMLIGLFRYARKIPAIYWLVSLALLLYTWNLDAWWFSTIGDEFSFYTYAREIIQQQNLGFIGEHLFYGHAVYGAHPYFSSLIQAVFMRIFGAANFGWRFSNPYLSALAVGLLYLFLRDFVRPRVAIWAAFFLGVSHYVMTFGKIGYNNLQALFAIGLVFWITGRAIQTRRLSLFALLGVGLGSCFYIYPAALYLIPLPLLLLLIYLPPRSRAALWRWAIALLTFLVVLFPLFLQSAYWQSKIAGTFLYNSAVTQTTAAFVGHFAANLFYAFFSFLYLPNESHFVVSSYVDPVSGALLIIGLAALLKQVRERFSAFLLVSYVFLLVAVGASHDRDYPPTTRMFLLLPWMAIFAAIGLAWFYDQFKPVGQTRRVAKHFPFLLMLLALSANIYMAYQLSTLRSERYQVLEPLYLKIAQRAASFPQPVTTAVICGESWDVGGLRYLQDIYGVPATYDQIVRVLTTDGTLRADSLTLLQSPYTVVIFGHGLKDEWRNNLEAQLQALPKSSCEITTASGTTRFLLWYTGALNYLCH